MQPPSTLIQSFGVCLSNILTGILLTLRVLGGSSPILYTIDCKSAGQQQLFVRARAEIEERGACETLPHVRYCRFS